jgi:hypothetical protein
MPQSSELGLRGLRALAVVNGLVATSAAAFWLVRVLTGDAVGYAVGVWMLLAILCCTGVLVDRRLLKRQGQRMSVAVAVADLLLIVLVAGTGVFLSLGSWLVLAGAAVVPFTYLAFFARSRSGRGHRDGPVLVAGLFALLTAGALARPWASSSAQWAAAAVIAATGTGVALLSATRTHHPTGYDRLDGASDSGTVTLTTSAAPRTTRRPT